MFRLRNMKNVSSQPITVNNLIVAFLTVRFYSNFFFAVELHLCSFADRFIIAKVFSVSALTTGF